MYSCHPVRNVSLMAQANRCGQCIAYDSDTCSELRREQHDFSLGHLPVIPLQRLLPSWKRLVSVTSHVDDIVRHVNPRLPDADPHARCNNVPLATVRRVSFGEVFFCIHVMSAAASLLIELRLTVSLNHTSRDIGG